MEIYLKMAKINSVADLKKMREDLQAAAKTGKPVVNVSGYLQHRFRRQKRSWKP
ncbi:MAG: hypothetical protein R2864_15040 [Syntrophotaleaceae bacterium]